MQLNSKDVLGLETMSRSEMELIIAEAKKMKQLIGQPVKKRTDLRGKVVVNLFFEPSTRTRSSFELAGKYLGADVINITASTSSVVKGETLLDTALTIDRLGTDILVMRHAASGAPHFLAKQLHCSVINAGDGMHEHPTQGLLDLYTMLDKLGDLTGKKMVLLGDIAHSRVARSNLYAMLKFGARVTLCGPKTLLPVQAAQWGVKVTSDIEEAVQDADVINVLRLQLERQKKGLFPSIREYHANWGLDERRLRLAHPNALVMHPGPMNRGVEIASAVADSLQSTIEEQVTNGVAVRMALLNLLAGSESHD
ncbi:MAG: aspartate carbamoyltransferase catalytic subunit [Negativicutes bacterium]|nr:aspartate carbamoyltransferase catalytic subunit [Negativicutes bacterium]